jgi:hypothetical protein
MKQQYWWAFNIVDIGFYYNSVKTYCESFSDVKIMLFDDFRMNPNNFIKRIYNFLNLDTQVNLKYPIIYNKTGIPKNRYLHNLLNNKNSGKNFVKSTVPKKLVQNVAYYLRNMNLDKPGMEFETMNKLKCIYEKDIKQLENYIKRGLSVWLD